MHGRQTGGGGGGRQPASLGDSFIPLGSHDCNCHNRTLRQRGETAEVRKEGRQLEAGWSTVTPRETVCSLSDTAETKAAVADAAGDGCIRADSVEKRKRDACEKMGDICRCF